MIVNASAEQALGELRKGVPRQMNPFCALEKTHAHLKERTCEKGRMNIVLPKHHHLGGDDWIGIVMIVVVVAAVAVKFLVSH